MGSLVRQILRKSPPLRLLLSSPKPSNPTLQSILPITGSQSNPNPSTDSPPPQLKLQSPIFPTFPFGFGFFPGPIDHPSSEVVDLVPDVAEDDASAMWADSVKKKRKKKMNKHKYKKLRKRLRRKT